MAIWGIVSNIIKTNFNSELVYHKFYLNPEKRFNAEKRFPCLYATVILIDSIYTKNENYYCSNSDKEYYCRKRINLLLETVKE